jgi:hypothetical protein
VRQTRLLRSDELVGTEIAIPLLSLPFGVQVRKSACAGPCTVQATFTAFEGYGTTSNGTRTPTSGSNKGPKTPKSPLSPKTVLDAISGFGATFDWGGPMKPI